MCGIVGVASSTPMSVQMKEFFQSLLFHDVVRGHHATGVAAIDTFDRSLVVEKAAVASPVFLSDKGRMESLFAHKHNFNIYIGHNRYATRGKADDDNNAHPFIHGDIVGVHNGSLVNQSLLDDHAKFVVDSDNLIYHLDSNGLNDTIQKANGAYALVWYDRGDNTLNFIRNDERPLAIGKLSNGCWVWASEMGMLKWLVKRHKQLSFAKYKKDDVEQDLVFNLQAFHHMKVEFGDRARTMKEERFVVKTPPVFPTASSYADRWGNDYYDSFNPSQRVVHRTSSALTETHYQKEAREVIGQFLINGNIDSWVEVEFLGHFKERTSGGYEASLSLFKYQSSNGKVVILHSFNHNACYTRDWTDADIGNRLYGRIAGAVRHNIATYVATKNEDLGFSFNINDLTLSRPHRFYPFRDVAEGAEASKEEGAADSKVVPFRGKQTPQQEAATTGKEGSEKSQSEPTDNTERLNSVLSDTEERMNRIIMLANGTCTYGKYLEMFEENHCRCSNCSTRLGQLPLNRIYMIQHHDAAEDKTYNYLSCKRACHEITQSACDAIDEDYQELFGGRDV